MNQKRLIALHNAPEVLQPCLATKDRQVYTVFELESDFNNKPRSYDFCVFDGSIMTSDNFDYAPNGYLSGILNALEPTLETMHFQPIAFIRANISGPLSPKAYKNIDNCEYDISKHQTDDKKYGFFATTAELGKFMLYDTQNNRVITMPSYVLLNTYRNHNEFPKRIDHRNLHKCFINAIKKMRQK